MAPKARNGRASAHPNISHALTPYARARRKQHVGGSRRPQMALTSDSIPMSMRVSGEPAEILAAVGEYKVSVRMPATLTACEEIDDLIADGFARLSANG